MLSIDEIYLVIELSYIDFSYVIQSIFKSESNVPQLFFRKKKNSGVNIPFNLSGEYFLFKNNLNNFFLNFSS